MAFRPRLRLRPVSLPHVPASAVVIAGCLAATFGTGATAVTASVLNHDGNARPAAIHPAAPPAIASAAPATVAAPPVAPTAHSVHAAPVPTSTKVPRPSHLVTGTVFVSGRRPLTRHQRHALAALPGVRRTETVSAGTARVNGNRAFMIGVNPATFRPWTPKLTAKSNPLWASIARGEVTASFDMGHGTNLPLGQNVPVVGSRPRLMRIGAFASVLTGVDAVVTQTQASRLGLIHHSGVLISAPKADPLVVRRQALAIVGQHARAELLQQVVITRDAGEYLTRVQISRFLHAAASRLGMPYVWGAEGPKSFDCSGLVQWSFAKAGIRMPRVSEQQWLTGPHISYADARPGDLLFWHYDPTDPGNIDHVAIYAGNGMMLVAPHTGTNVSYNPVPLAHLAGVVRVDPALAGQIS